MTDNFNPTEWITTQEAAELTGYEPAHIRYLAKRASIKGRKFGRAWMINRESVKEYADRMKQLGPARHDPWRTGARERPTDS